MSAILQIVDGHAGALVLELNGFVGNRAGLAKRGMNITEAQAAQITETPVWSPLASMTPLGRRRITIPIALIGTSPDDVGARVAKLAQATAGPWWLRVRRHGATGDSWLQCFGGAPQIDSQITGSNVAHIAQGTITCETAPYALGARVDGSAAIGQDPSTSAWNLGINNVLGDAPTPLLLRIHDPSTFGGIGAMGAFISCRRRQDPTTMFATSLTRQAESGSNTRVAGANVTMATLASDATFSGGGGVRVTFQADYNAGVDSSLTFAAPSLSGPNVPGVYRCFVRLRRNNAANTQQLVLRAFTSAALITPEEITVPANGANLRLVDLGLVQWPTGSAASISAPIPTPSTAQPSRVTLQFWRKSDGPAIIDFDYMCWIPADEDAGYLTTDGPLPDPATQWVVVDGHQQTAVITDGNPLTGHNIVGVSYGSTIPSVSWTGRVPRVGPGSNRVFFVAGTGGIAPYPVNLNLAVAYSYWPRYTWLK